MEEIKAALRRDQRPAFSIFRPVCLGPVFVAYAGCDIQPVLKDGHAVDRPVPIVAKSIFINAHADFITNSNRDFTGIVFEGRKGINVVHIAANGFAVALLAAREGAEGPLARALDAFRERQRERALGMQLPESP